MKTSETQVMEYDDLDSMTADLSEKVKADWYVTSFVQNAPGQKGVPQFVLGYSKVYPKEG